MQYKFDDEEDLGKVVKSFKAFSKLNKSMPVPIEKDIVGDFADPYKYPGLAGRKWSRLCGFSFTTHDGKIFQFVFVPKLKGTLSRNQKALSGWYCWVVDSADKDNKQVTSINDIKKMFGFNINKFVHSDLFDKYLKVFKEHVSYALSHQVEDLISQPEDSFEDYNELVRYYDAVKKSLAKIDEVKIVVTPDNKYDDSGSPEYAKGSAPKVGHAKIAYNADKTYDLRNNAKAAQQKQLRQRAIDDITAKANAANRRPEDAQEPEEEPAAEEPKVKFDPSLKHKFGGGRTNKSDDQIFDKYDDYDNDDYR